MGNKQQAEKFGQKIYAKDQNWRELTKRLAPCGLLTVTTKELQQLIK